MRKFFSNMADMFAIAWRNVVRGKRRTILTMLGIGTAMVMILFQRGFQDGSYAKMIREAVELNTGEVQIHDEGFWENQDISYGFIPSKKLLAEIEKLRSSSRVTGVSRRISSGVLFIRGEETCGAVLQGVDAAGERSVSVIPDRIISGGRYLAPGERGTVVLGEKLAKKLNVQLGSSLSFLSQGFTGVDAVGKDLKVVGIFACGNPEYDDYLAQIPLADAADIFDMADPSGGGALYVNAIVLRSANPDDVEGVRESLVTVAQGDTLEVMTWEKMLPHIVQFIVMDKSSAWLFIGILYLIAGFAVLNTMQMTVFERTREIGIMLALGTRPRSVIQMIITESMIITALALLFASIAGYALCYYFHIHPLDYSEMMKDQLEVWKITTTVYPADLRFPRIIRENILLGIIAFIFTIFPAWRAARLDPIRAIRHL